MGDEKQSTEMFYSIGQVSKHVDLPQSVLRYWEAVFDRLKPKKSAGGSRQYSEADVQVILTIKDLLYAKGFTIKGANTQLNEYVRQSGTSSVIEDVTPKSEIIMDDPVMPVISSQDYVFVLKELTNILEILED